MTSECGCTHRRISLSLTIDLKKKVLNCASGQVHAGLPASSLTSGIFQLRPDTVLGRADLFWTQNLRLGATPLT